MKKSETPQGFISQHIFKTLTRSIQLAGKDLKWWEKLLPWQKLYKRGFYSGLAYASTLQQKGIEGKKVIAILGQALRDKPKV